MNRMDHWGIVQQGTLGESAIRLPPGTCVHDNRKDGSKKKQKKTVRKTKARIGLISDIE